MSQKKVYVYVRRRSYSDPWRDVTFGEAGWARGKDPPGITCGAARLISPYVLFVCFGGEGCW